MEKALILEINEAEQETVEAINEIMKKHGLLCYLYEPIIANIYRQIEDGKKRELEQAKAQMVEAQNDNPIV